MDGVALCAVCCECSVEQAHRTSGECDCAAGPAASLKNVSGYGVDAVGGLHKYVASRFPDTGNTGQPVIKIGGAGMDLDVSARISPK